jgi:K+-transporting ATPase c subunit
MSASHLFSQTMASASSLGHSLATQGSQLGKQVSDRIANSSLTIGKSLTESVASHAHSQEDHFIGSYHVHVKQRLAEGGFVILVCG